MFSSAGYFKGLLCPFFLSGLCERPYCHFKHSKPEEGRPPLQRSTSNSSYIESLSDKPWSAKSSTSADSNTDLEDVKLNHNNSAQVNDNSVENANSAEKKKKEVIGYNKYTGEPIYEKFKQETYEVESPANVAPTYSTGGKVPVTFNKYTGKPIYENENHAQQITQKNSVPEYKPTPIEELKKQNKNAQRNDNEYDPEQNYSTKTITASHSLPYAPKRTISYEPTIIRPKKIARKTSYEFDISKFSDSDSDESENGKLDDEEEDEEYSPVPVVKEKPKDDKIISVEKETNNTKDDVDVDNKAKFVKDLKYFANLLLSDPKKSTLEKIRKSKSNEFDENSVDNDTTKKNTSSVNGEDKKIENRNEKTENKSTKRKPESKNCDKDVSQSKKNKPSTDLDDRNNKISIDKTKTDTLVKNKHSSSKHSHNSSSKSSHSKSDSSHNRKDSGSDSHKKTSSSHRKSDSSHKESSTNGSDSHKNSSHKKDESSSSSKPQKDSEKTRSQDKHSKLDSVNSKSESGKHDKNSKSDSKDRKSEPDKHSKERKSESSKLEKHDKSSSVNKHSSDRKHSHKSSHDHKHSSKNHSGSSKERNNSGKSSGEKHKTDERKKHHSSKSSTSDDKQSDKSIEKSSKVRTEKRLSTDSDSKRHIVDINVDLFGEDSDVEMLDDSDIETHPLLDDSDLDDGDLHDQCLRIYKESHQTKTKHVKKSSPEKKKKEEPIIVGKKRVAHDSGRPEVIKKIPEKPHSKLSPAQVMHNRFLEMRKKALEEAAKLHSNTPSSSSSSLNNTSSSTSNKTSSRVAHKPASSTKSKPEKTVITTASKKEKRQARIPNVSNLARPQIPAEFGSKVPTNVRQRYLNSIIDECLKLYDDAEEAFKRGQEEEMAVYKRSNTKTIYLNVAINAIKRLRNEIAEKSPSTSKPTKTIGAMKLSHEAVLGGKNATKTSYTIKRSGHTAKIIENFKGDELYKRLSSYILTEEQLKVNGFPMTDPFGTTVIYNEKNYKKNDRLHEKICIRCGSKFIVYPNGKYAKQEECIYHWAKAWKKKVNGMFDSRYNCCGGDSSSEGCQVTKNHVHETNKWETLTGYIKTLPCSPPIDGDYGVFAMDCEMVYTTAGLELARITVSDQDNNAVYESLVKPDNEVVDLNTRFSGITEEDLEGVTTSLRDVQAVLLSLFTDKTILIGHSLESDLMAVKIIHKTVVDTSVVFPHRLGPPYKRALRTLMAEYLQKIIQDDVGGHDSMEDAVSCMELMHMKIKEDARKENR